MNTNSAETQVISVPDGYIRDYVDGKPRKDTPEEYVRQKSQTAVPADF